MNKITVAFAVLFAAVSYFYLRSKTPPVVELQKPEQNNESVKRNPDEIRIERFVSEVKPPDTSRKGQDDELLDIFNSNNDKNCTDECDKATKVFDDYWAARNDFEIRKFNLKFGPPLTTNGIDYVEVAMDESKSLEEIKKSLWKSEFSDDDQNSKRKLIDAEIKELFEMLQKMIKIMKKIEALRDSDCFPCAMVTTFVLFHRREREELQAFELVLKYARKIE